MRWVMWPKTEAAREEEAMILSMELKYHDTKRWELKIEYHSNQLMVYDNMV